MAFQDTLWEWFLTLGWAVVGSLSMALALIILLKTFARFTPINEWEEIQKGNVAAAIVLASAVLAFGVVVAAAIKLL